jgi:hypothetical protein
LPFGETHLDICVCTGKRAITENGDADSDPDSW